MLNFRGKMFGVLARILEFSRCNEVSRNNEESRLRGRSVSIIVKEIRRFPSPLVVAMLNNTADSDQTTR